MHVSARRTVMRVGPALVAAAIVVGAGSGVAAAASGGSGIEVKKPWARTSAMAATNGAVYMVLKNTSTSDNALVGASVPSSVAAQAQIHETVMSGDSMDDSMDSTGTTMGDMGSTGTTMGDMGSTGTMQMREVDAIDVPAGAKVRLKPGGYHIMLVDLAAPLATGSKVKVTLDFEHGGSRTVKAVVKK
jgi:hypothetical protein